jgi:hypothetical protein
MPAYGLVPDSPLFYYAGKAVRTKGGGGRRGSTNSLTANVRLDVRFKNLVLYKPILNYEKNVPSGMVGRYMHEIGREIMDGARARVGVKTGALRRSIHIRHTWDTNGQTIKVGSSLSYALMHHEGTKPHIIVPKAPNKTLRFTKGIKVIHTPIVRHPGTKPNRYLSSQLRRVIK